MSLIPCFQALLQECGALPARELLSVGTVIAIQQYRPVLLVPV